MARRQSTAAFDDIASAFADYGTTVRGYVRYQLTRRNLKPYLRSKKLQVLDIGGGSGGDTAWLAGRGHTVTYLELSTEQRRFAERRFNFLLNEIERARVTMAGHMMEDLPRRVKYDLVLVHTVAMYQDDPSAFIRYALKWVKSGGLVSIIDMNYYGAEAQTVRLQDFTSLHRLHTTGRVINELKQKVHAFKPEDVERLLTKAGFEVIEWCGLRTMTDEFDMPAGSIGARQLKYILDTEYAHGRNPAIRGQGQLIHFIARKKS